MEKRASFVPVDRLVSELEGTWEISPTEQYLYDLAKEYHETCEAFDRTVCTGRIIRGSIMPVTNYEIVAINKHAISVRGSLIERANREHGIDKESVSKAIQKFTR